MLLLRWTIFLKFKHSLCWALAWRGVRVLRALSQDWWQFMYSEKLCHMYLTVQLLTSYYHNTAGEWKVLRALCWCCSYLGWLLSEGAGGKKAQFKPFLRVVSVFSPRLSLHKCLFSENKRVFYAYLYIPLLVYSYYWTFALDLFSIQGTSIH